MERASYELFGRRALGELPCGFALARQVPAGVEPAWLEQAPEEALWALHARLMESHRAWAAAPPPATPAAGEPTLLDVKRALGQRLLGPCRLCWLRCPVDRRRGETGACGLGAGLRPYRDFVHLGEELELIPTQAVFLAGCNYRCAYCSDWEHVETVAGDAEVDPRALARSIEARREEGARSLSFIGGLPDVNLPGILEALAATRVSVPVVWNSNLSASQEAADLLEGLVDAYVADLKYGAEPCARAGSGVKGSLEVTRRNLLRARAEAYLIVRHLVLPGHVDCCALPALDWLAEHLPGVRVNLLDQYQPTAQVRGTPWDRRPSPQELERARAHAQGLPLDLSGPGPLAPGPRAARRRLPTSSAAPPVAAFEATISIGADGQVILENLPPELIGLLEELSDLPGGLRARADAASPWREPPPAP